VDSYLRRVSGMRPLEGVSGLHETADAATPLIRRLIPFPGAETLSPPAVLSPTSQSSAALLPATAASLLDVDQQPASIVSQAASILDEEMAKGVIAAQGNSPSPGPVGTSNPVLHQLHQLVDNIAALWPPADRRVLSGFDRAPGREAVDVESLADLKPGAAVHPGQRATISMTVSNSEERPVRLVAAATDLLGSRGGRIAASLLDFMPAELSLEPGEQRDITIAVTVPPEATRGCYSGLLVVRGVDDLRALMTIEVV
jgi:hypothetical protein